MSKFDAVIITRSLRGGHYRCGQYHGPSATRFEPRTFTKQQADHLAEDPNLVICGVEFPEESGTPQVYMETVRPSEDGGACSVEWQLPGLDEPAWGEAAPGPAPKPKKARKKD